MKTEDFGEEASECADGFSTAAELWYPNRTDKPQYIEVGMFSVRATDGFRVTYDFERDGFVCWQQKGIHHVNWTEELDEWVEVAFIQSWSQCVESADES